MNDLFCSYQAVENMRNGMSPVKAAEDAVLRIAKYYPNYSGAIVAANVHGQYGKCWKGHLKRVTCESSSTILVAFFQG